MTSFLGLVWQWFAIDYFPIGTFSFSSLAWIHKIQVTVLEVPKQPSWTYRDGQEVLSDWTGKMCDQLQRKSPIQAARTQYFLPNQTSATCPNLSPSEDRLTRTPSPGIAWRTRRVHAVLPPHITPRELWKHIKCCSDLGKDSWGTGFNGQTALSFLKSLLLTFTGSKCFAASSRAWPCSWVLEVFGQRPGSEKWGGGRPALSPV